MIIELHVYSKNIRKDKINLKIRGIKPTREERKILIKNDIDTYEWLIQKHTSTEIQIIHKETGEVKVIKL